MIKSYLTSPHKVFHSFLIIIISILIFVIAIDLSATIILNQYLSNISLNLGNNFDAQVDFRNVYFDIFYGIFINGPIIKIDKDIIFDAKSIKLNLDYLDMIYKRQLFFKKISIQSPHIYKVDYFESSFLSFLLSSIKASSDISKSTTVKLYNLNFMDLINFDLDGYFALAQSKLLLTRGKINIKDTIFLRNTGLKDSLLNSPLTYVFEATYQGSDFLIDKLDLASRSARLILWGRIKDFSNDVNLELEGDLNNFLLEDIRLLNNDYLITKGILKAKFFINGPIENPDFRTNISILNTTLHMLDKFKVNITSSDLMWDNQGLRTRSVSGSIGKAPISLDLQIDNKEAYNKVNLKLSSQNLDLLDTLDVSFKGNFHSKVLEGNTTVSFRYKNKNIIFTKIFDFEDIFLDIKDLSFKSSVVDILSSEKDDLEAEDKFKKLEFTEINGNLTITPTDFLIDNIRTKICNGKVEGEAGFYIKDNTLLYNSRIYLEGVEIKNIAKEFLSKEYQLSGLLWGKIVINSEASDTITGNIKISDGKIENNALLIAISDFLGINSLRRIDFNNLEILFRRIWDKYEAQINLFSKDIGIYLDNKFFADETMDGYLLVKLTTKLMDESKRFRRLFKHIGYKEPIVYFPFKLKGYVDKPRIEWLKNEFKEKLQDFLSPSNKKILQNELNKLVEGLAK